MIDAPIPLPELRCCPTLFDTLFERNAAFIARTEKVAHFMCGSGRNLFPVERFNCRRSVAIDPDAAFIVQAKANAARQAPSVSDFITRPEWCAVERQLRRRPFAFRHEDLGVTSLEAASCRVAYLEAGHRGDLDYGAIAEEMHRVTTPGGRVFVTLYGDLRVENWKVDDVLAPLLRAYRRRLERSKRALARLGLTPLQIQTPLYARGTFNRIELLHYISRMPGMSRLVALRGVTALASIERVVRKTWGGNAARRLQVRCGLLLLEGVAPRRVSPANQSERGSQRGSL